MLFRSRVLSPLEKILCGRQLGAEAISGVSALRGSTVSFQIAVKAECNVNLFCDWESPLRDFITVREVGLVPCCQPSHPDDPYVIAQEPGYYPDPLLQLTGQSFRISRQNWHGLWVSVKIPGECEPGDYDIAFHLSTPEESRYEYAEQTISVPVRVMNAVLPPQKLRCTNWLYIDSMISQHRLECWSEPFWSILQRYFRNMAEHGTNMVLTPLWTLTLDAEGRERPTVQLLDICDDGDGQYRFDFSKLERWIDLATSQGISYFEMSHAYTQWGATHPPKIMVQTPDGEHQRFGSHVGADAECYQKFLRALMPELTGFLRRKGLAGRCYFHVSDEPTEKDFDAYFRASAFFTSLTDGFPVIDAVSGIDFYRKKAIRIPVPSTASLGPFMAEDISERWCYYCSGTGNFPNRYIGLPSLRNRVLGLLLFIYRMDGFLHWGYNAWYKRPLRDFYVNPYEDTEGGRFYSSGAGLLVYPGSDGPVDSLRHEVFLDGMQDLRALELLESHIGRERVMAIIQNNVPYPISMDRYPKDEAWYLCLMQRVYDALSDREGTGGERER